MDGNEKPIDIPLVPDHWRFKNKVEMSQLGIEAAREVLRGEFDSIVERKEVFEQVGGLIEALPHVEFVAGLPLQSQYNNETLGYRTAGGKVAIDADAMVSVDHAFQTAYHELLEELSARLGTHLRSFHKFHDGIIQYFVRQAAINHKRTYLPTAYEDIADIVEKLRDKGVAEELWKRALVNNKSTPQLIATTNAVIHRDMGFREIDWALDEEDIEKAKDLVK